jgi:hypothetical protein
MGMSRPCWQNKDSFFDTNGLFADLANRRPYDSTTTSVRSHQ